MKSYNIKPMTNTKWRLFYSVLFYYFLTVHLLPCFVSRVYVHTAGTLETDVAHLSIIVAVTSLVPNLKKNTPWLCMCVGGDVKAKERKKRKRIVFLFL